MGFGKITPAELDERRQRGGDDDLLLIDVREQDEFDLARIEGAQLLPLSRFNEWAAKLDPERETIIMCHHGIRSAQVCAALSRQGFTNLLNLSGGIDRWSCEVDRTVPRY
ncbi:MAG: rhodanese-related sulfurtransferase [Acidobacteria bacterium]|nr:rhodanese-related sulfurtransferase [Acidobacteriota bacterium]